MNSTANSVKVHSSMPGNISKSIFKEKGGGKEAKNDISNPNKEIIESSFYNVPIT